MEQLASVGGTAQEAAPGTPSAEVAEPKDDFVNMADLSACINHWLNRLE